MKLLRGVTLVVSSFANPSPRQHKPLAGISDRVVILLKPSRHRQRLFPHQFSNAPLIGIHGMCAFSAQPQSGESHRAVQHQQFIAEMIAGCGAHRLVYGET